MTDFELPPKAPIEFRRAGEFDVRFTERNIELVAIPYDVEVPVEYPSGSGRMVWEQVSRGAFEGIERRADRIKVNRDHNPERAVGRAVSLHPSRDEGLVAVLHISETDLGDDTLRLANDGVLEPSVEMSVLPSWQRWSTDRQHRSVEKAWLSAVSMVLHGAYGVSSVEDQASAARVLSVRQYTPPAVEHVATPNIDASMVWLRELR